MAQIPGYRIAGKTGTAERLYPWRRLLQRCQNHQFHWHRAGRISRYVVLAVVDERKGIIFGSTVAAPMLSRSWAATIERIPPVNQ